MRKYILSINAVDDTGLVKRPDGSTVRLDKIMIMKSKEWVSALGYEYASIVLGDSYCSCGVEVEPTSVCLLLNDGSILYPAKCCNQAVFFDNMVEVMKLD